MTMKVPGVGPARAIAAPPAAKKTALARLPDICTAALLRPWLAWFETDMVSTESVDDVMPIPTPASAHPASPTQMARSVQTRTLAATVPTNIEAKPIRSNRVGRHESRLWTVDPTNHMT